MKPDLFLRRSNETSREVLNGSQPTSTGSSESMVSEVLWWFSRSMAHPWQPFVGTRKQ